MVRTARNHCSVAKNFAAVLAVIHDKVIDAALAGRKRAGLVKEHRADSSQPFDGRAVAKQHLLPRRSSQRHPDRHRRRQAQGAGTSDQQHAQTGKHSMFQPRALCVPYQCDQCNATAIGKKQPPGDRRGFDSALCCAALPSSHPSFAARPRSRRPHELRRKLAIEIQRPAKYRFAGVLDDRTAFAGDQLLVDARYPANDLPIGGDPLAGQHTDAIPLPQFGKRYNGFAAGNRSFAPSVATAS